MYPQQSTNSLVPSMSLWPFGQSTGIGLASLNAPIYSTQDDIILGRGTLHTKHPGNVRFYRIVDSFLPQYSQAKTKFEKTDLLIS